MNNQGFHLSVTAISKAKNHSVVAKSAYNSGSKLISKLTGVVHDYTSKTKDSTLQLKDSRGETYTKVIEPNLVHTALITPAIAGNLVVTREGFWNAIEQVETRKNAQFGTEIDVMFPEGIGAEQRIELVETYSQTLSDRYNVLVDVAIHRPHSHVQHKQDGQVAELTTNNFHAHILLSSREILADGEHGYGLSKRKNWSQWSTTERLSKGLNGRGDELKYIRTLWAELANERLPENKAITEKSYREQGINRLPKMKLGKSLYKDVLKGNRSLINEYNETIDEINAYIEQSGLVIDYNDSGRIDLEYNVQTVNGKPVHYKKRKPFARIDLSQIRLVSPAAEPELELEPSPCDIDADNAKAVARLLALSDDIEQQKKMARSALLSTINKLDEELAHQAKQTITILKNTENLPGYGQEVGQDYQAAQEKMRALARQVHTQDESHALDAALGLVEQFRENNTLQTSRSVNHLQDQLEQIDSRVRDNKKVLDTLVPLNNKVMTEYKALKVTQKPFITQLAALETDFKALDWIDIEKTELQRHWREAFEDLQAIDVTNNMETYHKFAAFADLDVDQIKSLEQEREALSALKAIEINAEAENRLTALVSEVQVFKTVNDNDIKQLKQQITTSEKTYQRLSPFYEQRRELLDKSEAVIAQDDELHDEITSTKTTQLNADRLTEWRTRTMALHQQLIKAHEQAEREKKAKRERAEEEKRRQAQLEKERQQAALEQARITETAQYRDRFDDLLVQVNARVDAMDFKAIETAATVIAAAEKLAAEAFILETLTQTDSLTSLQKNLRDTEAKRMAIDVAQSTQTLRQALDKMPDDPRKIETLNELNARFEQVPEIRSGAQNLTQTLVVQVLEIENTLHAQARRYSSPRPF
ncbi:MobA/MobL family protein [Psychrobacter urativorans]|uniref:MobA/MobL protein domain-containing protein n=1 Tax=Psychrobacter urativorans TaxID=45610 RepID=A0A0M4T4G5_9GAMM|nr:MobA/MobL family protein [Psychrobacter urativorans]ALF60928.1 hypothetical protein AOC03_12130 [Psychrobacter urativorans]